MALNLSETKAKKSYPRIEDGTYVARIVRILDFGKQVATDWKTGDIKYYDNGDPVVQHRVWIDFEFPTEQIELDGVMRPKWVGKEYVVSAHEKAAIQALLKAADPGGKMTMKGRNVKGLLNLPLMVTIGSTSTGKAKVAAVSSLMKGMQVADLANPTAFFDLDEGDTTVFETLPQWMKDRITTSVDFDETMFYKKNNTIDGLEEDTPY